MCRSSGSEIYDLVWSPDGIYLLTGSMDNIARIYDSRDGITLSQKFTDD
jgi:chromatin assembly factor 1 subunit B